ncbi:acetyltransferase [Janthinobacterium sp. LB3P112]|uniref:acetyltransferase n=1 Tax=Janthinobacterium sp. LB3P112 TaxID=3424196 RepID=UPI003F21AE94
MYKNLVIFGIGGMGREAHQIVEDINATAPEFNFLGFLDEKRENHGCDVHGFPVLGGLEWLEQHSDTYVVIAIGNTSARRKIVASIEQRCEVKFLKLVHPHAWIGNRVVIGDGAIICSGARLTTDIVIGKHVIVNVDARIFHDARIHDYVTIAPSVNIAGAVQVGEGCDFGIGSTIIQGKSIGPWSIIGAGTVVIHDVTSDVTVVGVPAKVIKTRQPGWHHGL